MGSIGPTTGTRHRTTSTDVANLQSLLSSTNAKVLTPQDADYAGSIKRWSRAAEKPAGLVVVPTTAEEVSVAVKYASEHGLDVAVKGGGHSTAGVSSTDGGLLIDLGKMNKVDVDVERKLLRVQGGANWGEVDQASIKHGLATVGGTVVDTGVGGLALGGGYGWLSGKYGLVIDNMVECTTVLANGEIKKVSDRENADLFWGLKGAGQNFGVTTEFVLQAYEQGDVWAGLLLYPPTPDHVEKLVEALNNIYVPDSDGKSKVAGRAGGGLAMARPPPAEGKIMLMVPVVFFGSEEEGKKLFSEFFDIGPAVSTMAMVPYPVCNTLLAPPYGLRSSMKGASYEFPLRAGFVHEVLDSFTKFTDGNDDTGISLVYWEMFDPAQVATKEAGSFANRGWQMNGMICPIWTKEENDQECRQWARQINEMFKKELEAHGETTGPGAAAATVRGRKRATQFYGNYDHYDERSKDIFGDNYRQLQGLKAKYDPTNVFNKLFAVAPEV